MLTIVIEVLFIAHIIYNILHCFGTVVLPNYYVLLIHTQHINRISYKLYHISLLLNELSLIGCGLTKIERYKYTKMINRQLYFYKMKKMFIFIIVRIFISCIYSYLNYHVISIESQPKFMKSVLILVSVGNLNVQRYFVLSKSYRDFLLMLHFINFLKCDSIADKEQKTYSQLHRCRNIQKQFSFRLF